MTQKKKAVKADADESRAIFKPDSSMEQLISQAIDKNVAVDTMEKLLAMRRELKAEWAREQYFEALSDFQSRCPVIEKETIVRNKGGSERYRYADLPSIITQTKDLLRELGFSYRTDAKVEGQTVTGTCIATHKHGHSEQSSFMVPVDKEAFMNEPQKFASALTFTKRYAFCNVFGIQTGDADDDARAARGENEEAAVEGRAPEGEKHRPFRPYEEQKPTAGKSMTDLLELSQWLVEQKIPETFVVELLKEKKLAPPALSKLSDAPQGVIRRTLASRERLKIAYEASKASKGNGDLTAVAKKTMPKQERGPFDDAPGSPTTFEPKIVKAEDEDQSRGMDVRKPVQTDIAPLDALAQEGIDDWREVKIHFGKQSGKALGKVGAKSLVWWITEWKPKGHPKTGKLSEEDVLLDAALCLAHAEMAAAEARQ
jgi:ERF superfamily.